MNSFFSKYVQGYLRGSAKCMNTQYANWRRQIYLQVGSDKHLFLH